MDCILTIPITLAKFNTTALATLLAAQLGVAKVGVSCSWAEGSNNPIPKECAYQADTCLDQAAVFAVYSPTESDEEVASRVAIETKRNDPVIKELSDKLAVLEARLETKVDKPTPTPKPAGTPK